MSAALQRKLGQAHERLQAGDAAGAQLLCREVLQRAPRNPDALVLFAVTLLMTGRARDAISPLEQALAAQPRHGIALENLGLAHLMLGNFAEAQRALHSAAAIPGAPASVFMRLGIALLNQDQHDAALSALQRALELNPADADIHLNLGQVADRVNDSARARQHFETALRLAPEHIEAMFNLGVICLKDNKLDAARDWFARVLARAPRHADALVNLALVAEQQQQPDETIAHLRRAIEINPSLSQARNNLANTLMLQGRLEDARAEYLAALRLAPDMTQAREGLASICIGLGRYKEGIVHLRELLRVDSRQPAILVALADALFEVGEVDEAEAAAKRAMALDPSASGPYTTLADIHAVRGELDLMVAMLQAGVAHTGAVLLLGKLTFQLRRLCDWENWRTAWQQLAAALPDTREVVSPFSLLCEPLTAAQQLSYARRLPKQLNINVDHDHQSPPRTHRERVRIGYFSSDFYENAVAYLIAEVLELHDRSRFEVFAYSYGPDDNSPMRARMSAACEHFIDLARDPDDVAAARIRADEPDILIDLKGYTMGARPSILARRPCAIQVNWLGYPGTMGAGFIDYLIADPFIIPPDQESNYAERVLRMPHCYQPNDRKRPIAPTLDRAAYGLPESGFVFCSFNQGYKITPEIFACWMNLLRRTPDSVLWLLAENRWTTENLTRAAQCHEIDSARLIFAPKVPLSEHLARYRVADLALDTFPYGSHTTASDALWAGCPLVALCGQTFAARVSGSILSACGLPELVTHTLEDYERLASHIATDAPYRDVLRAKLETNRLGTPLFDSRTFARDLENIYIAVIEKTAPKMNGNG
jgi:predicted O-linked N-acetylglucosamine transferase (SPINDLY family)